MITGEEAHRSPLLFGENWGGQVSLPQLEAPPLSSFPARAPSGQISPGGGSRLFGVQFE